MHACPQEAQGSRRISVRQIGSCNPHCSPDSWRRARGIVPIAWAGCCTDWEWLVANSARTSTPHGGWDAAGGLSLEFCRVFNYSFVISLWDYRRECWRRHRMRKAGCERKRWTPHREEESSRCCTCHPSFWIEHYSSGWYCSLQVSRKELDWILDSRWVYLLLSTSQLTHASSDLERGENVASLGWN